MSKLFSASILRLKKNKLFWSAVIFMTAAAIFFPIIRFWDMKNSGMASPLENGFFSCAVFIAVILAVFCSLFIGTEYSDGVIRNKITVGHKRLSIYLTNLLVSTLVSLLLLVLFFVVYLCVGIPLLGFFETDIWDVLLFSVSVMVLSFAFSAIYTMIAMINSNKAVTAVICILSVFILLMVGSIISARLQEPEYYPDFSFTENGNSEIVTMEGDSLSNIKNQYYLEGTERAVYQFLYDFLPGGQVSQCSSMTAENLNLLPLYSLVIFIMTTFIGFTVFRRKDIK